MDTFWQCYCIVLLVFAVADIWAISTGKLDMVYNIVSIKTLKLSFLFFHFFITLPLSLKILGVF